MVYLIEFAECLDGLVLVEVGSLLGCAGVHELKTQLDGVLEDGLQPMLLLVRVHLNRY